MSTAEPRPAMPPALMAVALKVQGNIWGIAHTLNPSSELREMLNAAYAAMLEATNHHAASAPSAAADGRNQRDAWRIAILACITTGGEVRRDAWEWAAGEPGDILHTGPRTRAAQNIGTALGHLQRALEYVRKG